MDTYDVVVIGAVPAGENAAQYAIQGSSRTRGGPATVRAGGSTFEVDEIVVAAGRRPATSDLGLERVGSTSTSLAAFFRPTIT